MLPVGRIGREREPARRTGIVGQHDQRQDHKTGQPASAQKRRGRPIVHCNRHLEGYRTINMDILRRWLALYRRGCFIAIMGTNHVFAA